MSGSGSPAASPSGQSDNSGTTTNPNTPRSEVNAASSRNDYNSENGGLAQAGESSPGRSTAFSERAYNLAPSLPPSKVDMTRLPATIEWQNHHQPDLSLDIHWAFVAKKALFKLRFPVSLERFPGLTRCGRAFLLLLIYPERILQLSLDEDVEAPRTGKNARAHATALHFGLDRPAVVVMPSRAPCESSNKDSDDMITSLRQVASQTSFTIYFDSSNIRKTRDAKWLPQLCVAASRRALTTIVKLASVATLYGGQGGELIEGETFSAPPEYNEVGRATPSMNSASTSGATADRGKKRRRSETGSDSVAPAKSHGPQEVQDLLNEHLLLLRKEMVDLVEQAEARVLRTIRAEMDQKFNEIEDRLGGKLPQMVEEEMAEVEDSIMDRLTSMPLRADLTFADHPWH